MRPAGDRGGERRPATAPTLNATWRPPVQVGRHDDQRDLRGRRNPPAPLPRQELGAELLGIDRLRRRRSRPRTGPRSVPTRAASSRRTDLGAVVRELDDVAADVLAATCRPHRRRPSARRSRCRRWRRACIPISSSASITAIWASPRAPPPPSASAKLFIRPPRVRAPWRASRYRGGRSRRASRCATAA